MAELKSSATAMSSTKVSRRGRPKKVAQVYQCPNEKQRWTFDEKRTLLEAVQRHGSQDVSVLQRYIPSRSCKEIEWLIKGIKINKDMIQKRKTSSPIDKWANLVDDLVHEEKKDFSLVLAQVMAVVSHNEYSNTTPTDEVKCTEQPNYSRLYQYIEALLLNKPAIELSGIESAIMLDLMYGLAMKLRESDLTSVKALMMWKYELLTKPVVPGQRDKNEESLRKALENDFLTLRRDEQRKSASTSPSSHVSGKSPEPVTLSPGTSNAEATRTSDERMRTGDEAARTSGEGMRSGDEATRTSGEGMRSGDEATRTSDEGTKTSEESQNGVVGIGTQTEVVGIGTQTEEPVEHDGNQRKKSKRKRKSSAEKSTENSPSKQASTEISTNKPSFLTEYVLIDKDLIPLSSVIPVAETESPDEEDDNQQSTNRKRTKIEIQELKKPSLYTLNPLCIPVSFLKLRPKYKKGNKKM